MRLCEASEMESRPWASPAFGGNLWGLTIWSDRFKKGKLASNWKKSLEKTESCIETSLHCQQALAARDWPIQWIAVFDVISFKFAATKPQFFQRSTKCSLRDLLTLSENHQVIEAMRTIKRHPTPQLSRITMDWIPICGVQSVAKSTGLELGSSFNGQMSCWDF